MHWLIVHMAEGDAFLMAGGLILILLPMLTWVRSGWVRWGMRAGIVFGAIMVSLSSIPMPRWAYFGWMAVLFAALFVLPRKRGGVGVAIGMLVLAELVGLALVGSEILHRRWDGVAPLSAARVYVIGDSLSAGTGQEAGQTWPRILAEARQIEVVDLAVAAATVKSITKVIEPVEFDRGLVILEIGGNDVFGHEDPRDFERDLEVLVNRVQGEGRVLTMFELPLYPLNGEYGRVQRRIAARHGIALIPRWLLAQVIIKPGNTIPDGLHLSIAGHRDMATRVWDLIAPVMPNSAGPGWLHR